MKKIYKPSEIMKQMETLGWVRNFDLAIKGQYYFLPRGTQVFNQMTQFLKNWVQTELNSMEIKTPILYNWSDDRIQAESSSFDERVFKSTIDEKKTAILRPGGDYGVMSLFSRQRLSENHLPISLFELVTSFRKCQSRELAGVLKARAFTLLDHHTFTANTEQAWDAYIKIILSQAKLGDFFGFSWEFHCQIDKSFFMRHEEQIKMLENKLKKTPIITILENQTNYWVMQHHFIDSSDNIGFSDGQYDEINAKNYQIKYTATNGIHKNYPIICHGAFDSIERWIFKLVSRSIDSKGYDFPLWLSPIHIRLIPYNEKTFAMAQVIKNQATACHIKSDIDFRKKNITERIKQAKNDWVPFIVLFSDNFNSQNTALMNILTLDNNQTSCSIQSLFEHIQSILYQNANPISFFSQEIHLDSVIGKPNLR